MQRLSLPEPDPQIVAELQATRDAYNDAALALGDAELRAAASIIRQIWGDTAWRLLVDKNTNDDGVTTITPLVLLDGNEDPIWFASGAVVDYPGTDAISNDHGLPEVAMGADVLDALANHIEAAYEAFGGELGDALYLDPDEYLPEEWNVLGLHIPMALGTS